MNNSDRYHHYQRTLAELYREREELDALICGMENKLGFLEQVLYTQESKSNTEYNRKEQEESENRTENENRNTRATASDATEHNDQFNANSASEHSEETDRSETSEETTHQSSDNSDPDTGKSNGTTSPQEPSTNDDGGNDDSEDEDDTMIKAILIILLERDKPMRTPAILKKLQAIGQAPDSQNPRAALYSSLDTYRKRGLLSRSKGGIWGIADRKKAEEMIKN